MNKIMRTTVVFTIVFSAGTALANDGVLFRNQGVSPLAPYYTTPAEFQELNRRGLRELGSGLSSSDAGLGCGSVKGPALLVDPGPRNDSR